jgi:acetoin utilization deacetylase AcuC-like enzyme
MVVELDLRMKVVYSEKLLGYGWPGHSESAERVRLIYEALKGDGRYEWVEPKAAREEDLLLVHEKRLVEAVKNLNFKDADTPRIEGIYGWARLAVGGAMKAAELALEEGKALALVRPPGHHAGKNFLGGFCYFNNLAVAVANLLERKGVKRAAILDVDVHHGNGTQDIFLGSEKVVFCSLHQWPLYPGSGRTSEGNCHNFPLPAGTDGKGYLKALDDALGLIGDFRPEVLGVSLGLDTYKEDPLANFDLERDDYRKMGERIAGSGWPTFFSLEGGYSAKIGECVKELLEGVLGD